LHCNRAVAIRFRESRRQRSRPVVREGNAEPRWNLVARPPRQRLGRRGLGVQLGFPSALRARRACRPYRLWRRRGPAVAARHCSNLALNSRRLPAAAHSEGATTARKVTGAAGRAATSWLFGRARDRSCDGGCYRAHLGAVLKSSTEKRERKSALKPFSIERSQNIPLPGVGLKRLNQVIW
jgi:hypothetical protein